MEPESIFSEHEKVDQRVGEWDQAVMVGGRIADHS